MEVDSLLIPSAEFPECHLPNLLLKLMEFFNLPFGGKAGKAQ
jgi:hypothetical protein